MLAHALFYILAAPRWIIGNNSPVILVFRGAANVHHVIDCAAASQTFATGYMMSHAFMMFLRLHHLSIQVFTISLFL